MTQAGFPATQALISQWESGGVALTAERAVQIETVTGGMVRREELRPDLFGPHPEQPPARRGSAAPEGGDAAEAVGVSVQSVSEAA